MAHLPLGETQELTTYRKIAIAAWRHPRDPSTYSWLDLPVEAAEAFLKTFPGGAGAPPRPSLTHYIAKIVAHCLEEHPELNHLLRRDRLQRRQRTDVFITTLLKTASAADLSGFPIRDAARLSLAEIARLQHRGDRRVLRAEPDAARQVDVDAGVDVPGRGQQRAGYRPGGQARFRQGELPGVARRLGDQRFVVHVRLLYHLSLIHI